MKNIFIVQLIALVPFVLLLAFAVTVLLAPALRREKSRLLVDLIAGGLKRGHSPEQTLVSICHLNDPSIGYGIYSLAWKVERGQNLPDALTYSTFFPRELAEVFRAGYQLGNLETILPAAREAAGPPPLSRNASHYLILCATTFSPIFPAVLTVMSVFVFPKFEMLYQDLGSSSVPMLSRLVFDWSIPLAAILTAVSILIYFAVFLNAVTGPAFKNRWWDEVLARLPWIALRLRRKFVGMLARLLDGAVPEERALQLAALSTGNSSFLRVAERARAALSRGVPLDQAIGPVDPSGQLSWRLRNVSPNHGFLSRVQGWLEMMEAQAFKSHQTAIHGVASIVLIFMGALIGTTVAGIFLLLIRIIESEALW